MFTSNVLNHFVAKKCPRTFPKLICKHRLISHYSSLALPLQEVALTSWSCPVRNPLSSSTQHSITKKDRGGCSMLAMCSNRHPPHVRSIHPHPPCSTPTQMRFTLWLKTATDRHLCVTFSSGRNSFFCLSQCHRLQVVLTAGLFNTN